MARRIEVAVVGGGSYGWMPTLMRDIILTPGLEEVSFRLLDVNRRAAEETATLGRRMSREWNLGATFLPTDD
jgi:alpha-galactosidase/6-phospho-beta-glucosidase family protein